MFEVWIYTLDQINS